MQRQGLVTEVKNDLVSVQLLRHSACSNCGGCAIGKAESKTQIVTALNKANAKEGQYVELVMPKGTIANAALIAYGIPLVALLTGLLIGSALELTQLQTFGIGLIGLLGSFAFNRFFLERFRKSKNKYQVVAISIVDKENVEGVF
ncbi:SoxR reducing system RseC family protein [Clostridium sp. 'deep sea']|uniref:SoxR reducing system RseC family protein n=1 Tax=Clostridium sp. 'deep sea' TaxID=2779445 RepID=UPI0018968C79|nr:SoxR reducing system RseC family protein [Clostridium sp. 'deep sea']QOR35692.1 SoxR reducing system RseC family protein [Clostridium sp. 'deep sea']